MDDPYEKGLRVQFGGGPGVAVKGWPSKGGIYILSPCFGVELDFLGLDRFKNTEAAGIGSDEEEAHCNKMRQLGAVLWESREAWVMSSLAHDSLDDAFLVAGWPAGGGVWVLKATSTDAIHKGAAVIYNAYSMEERCKAIEQAGGNFYADPKDCPDLDLD